VFPEPPNPARRPSFALIVLVALYQTWLMAALLIHRFIPVVGPAIGDFMTFLCAYVFNAPGVRRGQKRVSAVQNYYYLRFWQGMLSGPFKTLYESHSPENRGSRRPEVPLLFVYGTKKPIQFFHASLLPEIEKKTDGSKQLGVPTGHWVTRSPLLTKEIKAFFGQ
jgi:hypothetical protein